MVMMCSWRSLLILSSMAARVVDLPEPVGPVTRMRPRGRSHSLATTGGEIELGEALDLKRNDAEDRSNGSALVEDVGAEAGQALESEGEIEFEILFEAMLLGIGHHRVGQLLGVGRTSGGISSGCRWPWTRTCGGELVVM